MWGFGKTQCLHSLPERPKLRDLPEDQNHKGPVQKTYWQSRTSCRKFWWFDYSRAQKFSVKVVNLETIIDMQSWCRTWPLNGSSRIRAKQKLHRKAREVCKSSWSRIGSLKSFTLTIPWILASPVKNYPGIIVRHQTDHKRMGLLREQCAERKKGHLRCYSCTVLMLSAETCKISCLMGRHNMTSCSECHLTDQWIPFGAMVEYHPISAKDQSRLHQFGAKVLPDVFLGYALYTGRIWKGDIVVGYIEELEEVDASELHARRKASENIHFHPGSSGTRRRTGNFFWKIWWFFQPHFKKTQRGMMKKLKVTSGLFLENSSIVITLNPQSNCTCGEKNHFLFRWSTSTSPEQRTHHWISCWQKRWKITGTWMEKKNCQVHGQDSQKDTPDPGRDLQENKQPLVQTMYGH